jgi:hypothetical protein
LKGQLLSKIENQANPTNRGAQKSNPQHNVMFRACKRPSDSQTHQRVSCNESHKQFAPTICHRDITNAVSQQNDILAFYDLGCIGCPTDVRFILHSGNTAVLTWLGYVW